MPSDPKEKQIPTVSDLPFASMADPKRETGSQKTPSPVPQTIDRDPRGSYKRTSKSKKQALSKPKKRSPSWRWRPLKTLFSCRHQSDVQGKKKNKKTKKNNKIGCSVSLCRTKDSTNIVMPEAAATPEACKNRARGKSSVRIPCKNTNGDSIISASFSSYSSASITVSATSSSFSASSLGGSFRVMHLRRLSGCYESQVMVDSINGPSREPSMRATISFCPTCWDIFARPESLELHQALRHAVSELGPEDTSRNIVEIIFQSSWLKSQAPVCKIDRILKVHNTQKTISRFEDYRDSIKVKANKLAKKQHPRCVADGNELLRFHSTSLACSLGLNGSTHICQATKPCSVCGIIRDGFKVDELGRIPTMATSWRAHDMARDNKHDDHDKEEEEEEEKRAMLVCRVIAGRVRRGQEGCAEEFDSVAEAAGAYSSLDELFVSNPKAILPCFVVIYGGF